MPIHATTMSTEEIQEDLKRLFDSCSYDEFMNECYVYVAVLRDRGIKMVVDSKLEFSPIV